MRAKKRFGQNFLHDRGMINKIVAAIRPKTSDVVVEIGPGQGAMTQPLLALGCVVHAIEIDDDLIQVLEQKIRDAGFILHHADALTFDFSQISLGFRLVGNLPYNISTPLLFHLMRYASRMVDITVMLQREVVDRIVAEPNSKIYGRLSVMLQYYCEVDRLFLIPPGVFEPIPKVESALLRLVPKTNRPLTGEEEILLEACVKLAFAQRRKTIKNNLRTLFKDDDWLNLPINPQSRAENLSVQDFIFLTQYLSQKRAIQ